jgi:hypothetical protein
VAHQLRRSLWLLISNNGHCLEPRTPKTPTELAAGLEREQFGISRELLQFGQQFSYRHASPFEV